MRKIYIWVLTGFFAAIISAFGWFSLIRFQNARIISSNCDRNFRGLQYEFVAKRTADEIFSSVHLINARDKRSFRFLTFAGDLQIITPSFSPLVVDCGETGTVKYNAEKLPRDKVTNILIRELPIIPDRLVNSDPTNRFKGTESFFLDYALDRSDFKTLQTNKRRLYSSSENLEKTKSVSTTLNDGYIFFSKDNVPDHVFYTSKSKIPFGIYFSDVSDTINRTYTITCLLNDRQIYAFHNRRSWSGKLNKGQGIYLSGEVDIIPGWSQLRCVILNNLYDPNLPVTLYPGNIRATYVYLSKDNLQNVK